MDDILIQMMRLSQKGYGCSQILMRMALDMRGEDNPALVRAMAGLAYGCGFGSGTCGVLTGAASVLALYVARGADGETESERFLPMLQDLNDWFGRTVGGQYGGITCESVVGEGGKNRSMHQCGRILSDTFTKLIEILSENGFDLSG